MQVLPETIRLVAFDLDGTLVDAYPAIRDSLNYMLGHFGLPPCSLTVVKRSVGWGVDTLVGTFVNPQQKDEALRIFREHHDRRLRRDIRLLPGAGELLSYLDRQGCRLAVASNRPTEFCLIILESLGIRGYFSEVRGGDSVSVPKPDPEILRCVLKGAGIPASEAVYVGDMTVDILCGRQAGVITVAVPTGSCTLAQIRAEKPDILVRSLDELRALFAARQKARFPTQKQIS
jgi:phosphoglycolate phosphatase